MGRWQLVSKSSFHYAPLRLFLCISVSVATVMATTKSLAASPGI